MRFSNVFRALVLAFALVLGGGVVAQGGTAQPGTVANGSVLGTSMPTLVTLAQPGPAGCPDYSGLFPAGWPNQAGVRFEFAWPFPSNCSGFACLPTAVLYRDGAQVGGSVSGGFDSARGVFYYDWQTMVAATGTLTVKVGHLAGTAPTFSTASGHIARLIASDFCD